MANHARVFKCETEPTRDAVLPLVGRFMAETLKGHGTLVEGGGRRDCWRLGFGELHGVEFWLDPRWDFAGCGDGEPGWSGPVVEFRHGHYGSHAMWWVDFALEHYLASRLGGRIVDEGTGEPHDPDWPAFADFNDHLCRVVEGVSGPAVLRAAIVASWLCGVAVDPVGALYLDRRRFVRHLVSDAVRKVKGGLKLRVGDSRSPGDSAAFR